MSHPSTREWERWLVGLLLAAVLILLLVRWDTVTRAYLHGVRWLEPYVREAGVWGAVAFAVFAALSVLLGPFSSGPLVPSAVLAWGQLRTFSLLLLGWMLGNITAYAIGRYAASPLLRRLVPWQRIEEWMDRIPRKRMLWLAVLLRLTLPSEVGYAYGVLRFNFAGYVALTLLAELPTALLLVYGSSALLNEQTTRLFMILGLGMSLLLAGWIVRGALRHGRGRPGARNASGADRLVSSRSQNALRHR
jgi:uncharacterized membrane protein YdjX (TVP38/TMEM64 family)